MMNVYEVPYKLIDKGVEAIIESRSGINNPKVAYTKSRVHQELMGTIMGVVDELQLPENVVSQYLDLTLNHNFKPLPTDGKVHLVHHYVDEELFNNPLYYALETTLMKYKPASVQCGVGEFFFCWYDKDSVFGIDNTLPYDIIVQGDWECKGLNSQKTANPTKMDHYMETASGIMVISPYDNRGKTTGKLKLNPDTRSVFCINTNNWRDSFQFEGDTLKFVNQTSELKRMELVYKIEKYEKKLAARKAEAIAEHGPESFLAKYMPVDIKQDKTYKGWCSQLESMVA